MRNQEVHVPNPSNTAGGIKDSATVKRNIRRLSSLADLLGKGGTALNETLQFLQQAIEEIENAEHNEQLAAQAQEQLAEEKAALMDRVNRAEEDLQQLRGHLSEKENELAKSNALMAHNQQLELEKGRVEKELEELRSKLNDVSQTNVKAVKDLEAHTREQKDAQKKLEQSEQKEAELARENAALKTRVKALETQLEAEKERRSRSMEVVKTHDVTAKKPSV